MTTPTPRPHTPEGLRDLMEGYFYMQCRYQAAIRQVRTKLEILDDEFQMRHRRNPIHHMESRLKTAQSIIEKLKRKGFPVTLASAMENLTDIAGVRMVCSYIDDIYAIAALLRGQDDVTVLEERDYIQNPKPNGYRSLHLILRVPVYLCDGKEFVRVEVQIRTVAMDFWATLEHQLRYKDPSLIPQALSQELVNAADEIAAIDRKMQGIHDMMDMLASDRKPPAQGGE